ncbi:hypothetical protein MLD38_005101 [Melastoma candidum]|uniref:Uncharacterized protein n=1 Tax=Melastoma candidum TaxID=119954 RepID=A0ACB9S7A9_9MYRT|nr:hypothetical protein MLD38_005101 [Melastoma candidum]
MDPQSQSQALAMILESSDVAPFETLIGHLMSSSNNQRSSAESIFNLAKQSDPNSLSLKLSHLIVNSTSPDLRAMSAVLLRKLLTQDDSYVYPRVSPQTQSVIK